MRTHTYNLNKLEQSLATNSPVKLATLGAELCVNEYPLLRRAILRAIRWQQARCQLISFLNGLAAAACGLLCAAAIVYCLVLAFAALT